MALLIFGQRQCESLIRGMSNSSDTRASFFRCVSRLNNQIQKGFGVLGVAPP